ncbi:hypothetical protein [Bacillus sp. FJAT-45066]|uniref:hypothetical protein n=1 Tax=Bacillus sp. FJAT-45066 TaxID=2011010 RepID=UPI00159698CF|nr:hypothetical protein [Bacillus sp. FJAT-45066]
MKHTIGECDYLGWGQEVMNDKNKAATLGWAALFFILQDSFKDYFLRFIFP